MNRKRSRTRERALFLVFFALCAASCSLLIQHNTDQCSTDADCAQFPGSVCEPGGHVCVAKTGGVCEGDAGCWACAPTTTPQFLNACTNAACVAFDDVARCKNLLPDGGLPPIPDAGSD